MFDPHADATAQHSDTPTRAHTCNVLLRIAEVYHSDPHRLRVATFDSE